MWKLNWTNGYESRLKRLRKQNTDEVVQTLLNLETYQVALNCGVKPMQLVKNSFVRNEKMGIHAIDQTPLKKGKRAIRLYVYPCEQESILYLITIGDKDQQEADLQDCCDFVRDLQRRLSAEQATKT